MPATADDFALNRITVLLNHCRTFDQVRGVADHSLTSDLSLPARHHVTPAETLGVLRATASAARARELELSDLLKTHRK